MHSTTRMFDGEESSATREKCPRCRWNDLSLDGNDSEISFYVCSNCLCQFAKRPQESLHDRWGSPISVALYSQIFEIVPEQTGRTAADSIYEKRRDLVSWLIYEIRRELANPTQCVSEIHDFACKDEAKLRQHLSDLGDRLTELQSERDG